MRASGWIWLSSVLLVIVAFPQRPSGQAPAATFHAVGDLPGGGAATVIRDATRAGGVIYAVGGAMSRESCGLGSCRETDTAILWSFDGTNATLEALPDVVTFTNTNPAPGLSAYAITADAAFVASQARTNAGGAGARRAVRVTRSPVANLTLGTSAFITAGAVAISSGGAGNGKIVYGSTNLSTTNFGAQASRGRRFDADNPTAFTELPVVTSTDTWNPVAERGSSASGDVAVGSSFSTAANHKAYRYVHGAPGTVAAIALLPGGTYNDAVAVSPDGTRVLVTGNSSAAPNGEAYIHTAGTNAQERLGSPNPAWKPGGRWCVIGACVVGGAPVSVTGGMTSDGSVVAMSFRGEFDQYAYFHNSHGWFHLTSALGANGVDVAADGWSTNSLHVQGISSDGTLVFGSGMHNDTVEGFVAEFGPGVLANFNPPAAPPANTAIVGVWSEDEVGAEDHFIVFTADGAYYQIEDAVGGFERGSYTFDGNNLRITTRLDTNGSGGLSDQNGSSVLVGLDGDTAAGGALHRITGSPGAIVGGWVGGDSTQPDSSLVIVFTATTYGTAQDLEEDGSETGTYTWDVVSHELNVFPTGGTPDLGNSVALTADGRGLIVVDDGGESFSFTRIIDPGTIPVIAGTPLSASGIVGQAFTFAVTATNAASFAATGLPDGLSMDASTGGISGTPSVDGQFAVAVTATNAVGVADIETLTLTIALPTPVAIPTPVGQNVVVAPEVPGGQGPVTLTFGEITGAGTTTVTVLDPGEVPAPGNGNVAIAGVVYDVTTTASYEGLITLCFSYANIDFGSATPRLFHYENTAWVDITTSVDPATQSICGATTTLSPFAVLVSNVVRTGFYAPLNPIAGYLNTANGGSTVPLKFNVSINGVAQTTTDGLALTQQLVACDSSAPQDEVEPASVTGGTSLRYDSAAHQFIQNWKVPKTPGLCYMVRVTTEQDGLALTARFKVR